MTDSHDKPKRKRNREQRRAERKRNYAKGAKHNFRSHQPWTQEDDKKITELERPTDRELAKQLGRTVRAIQQRRNRLRHGAVAKAGLSKAAPEEGAFTARKGITPFTARVRASALGLKFGPDETVKRILAVTEAYRPYHDLGIKPGLRVRLPVFGDCEVIEIMAASRQATVKLPSGSKRNVPLTDLSQAVNQQRVADRARER